MANKQIKYHINKQLYSFNIINNTTNLSENHNHVTIINDEHDYQHIYQPYARNFKLLNQSFYTYYMDNQKIVIFHSNAYDFKFDKDIVIESIVSHFKSGDITVHVHTTFLESMPHLIFLEELALKLKQSEQNLNVLKGVNI